MGTGTFVPKKSGLLKLQRDQRTPTLGRRDVLDCHSALHNRPGSAILREPYRSDPEKPAAAWWPGVRFGWSGDVPTALARRSVVVGTGATVVSSRRSWEPDLYITLVEADVRTSDVSGPSSRKAADPVRDQ